MAKSKEMSAALASKLRWRYLVLDEGACCCLLVLFCLGVGWQVPALPGAGRGQALLDLWSCCLPGVFCFVFYVFG